jgi:hypothetical protein
VRGRRRCPADFVVTPAMLEWAARDVPHVDLLRETEKFKDHEYRKSLVDWEAAWRNWMRIASEGRRYQSPQKETAYARHQRERVAAFTGGLVSTKHTEGDLFDAANLLGR